MARSLMLKITPLLAVMSLTMSFSSNANGDQSIILTQEMIQSSEQCYEAQTKKTVQLKCSAYRQTTPYTCGPAAVMSLMRYYGKLKPFELNKTTEMLIAKEMGATSEGTSPAQLETWLSNHGFTVKSGYRIDTDQLIKNIEEGKPTIVGYSNHWLLAKGYIKGKTPSEDEVIFADSSNTTTKIYRERIDSMWLEAQLSNNRCPNNGEYIVATPKN